MPSKGLNLTLILLALLSVSFAVRRADKATLDRSNNGQEAQINSQLQENLYELSNGRYFSLLQKATAGAKSQESDEQLSSVQPSTD